MADISNLIGKLNNSNEEVIDQLNENNEHVSRTNNLIQNLTKVLTGNDLQEAEDKRELNSLLKKLSEGKGDGKSGRAAGKETGGGLLSLLGKGLLSLLGGLVSLLGGLVSLRGGKSLFSVIGAIIKILGAKSPLATAVKMLKDSKIGKTFVSIFKRISGFFGKDGKLAKTISRFFGKNGKLSKGISGFFGKEGKLTKTISGFFGKEGKLAKIFKTIKSVKGPFLKGLKFLGRLFGRIFAIFSVITALRDANEAFNETEGDFTTKLSAALKEFGASLLNALFGWVPKLFGHILEFVGAPKWLTDPLKEFDLKAETKLLADTFSLMLDDTVDALMPEVDGSALDLPEKYDKRARLLKEAAGESVNQNLFQRENDNNINPNLLQNGMRRLPPIDTTKLQNIRARNLELPSVPPVAPVIVPVPAAGPSGTGGGSGTVINVNNGSDSSIRDAQNRALQGGPPSMFQFFPIP
jgi:hypothetical protein